MNKEIMKDLGFGDFVDAVEKKKCPVCGNSVNEDEFESDLERREFKISGLCKKCQDEIFKNKKED